MMKSRLIPLSAAMAILTGCGTQPVAPSSGHLMEQPAPQGAIPAPVRQSAVMPPPRPAPKTETYSVVVNDVPVRELLFALARDAKINVDIHPGIEGNVTLNALNQTLPQLLNRISKQVDMRYELDGPNLAVMPDTPYLKQYKIDYLNMSRDATSNVSIATQIATSGAASIGSTATGSAGSGQLTNNSSTAVTNKSNHRFWETLVKNVQDLLRETDKILPEGSSITTVAESSAQTATPAAASPNPATVTNDNATTTQKTTYREAASVIANPENGLLAVRATSRQHEKVQEFLDQVVVTARRQVMIEATVVEVQLSDQYQQGINWNALHAGRAGWELTQGQVGTVALPSGINPGTTAGLITLTYRNAASKFGNILTTVQLLESFGKVKVLSSPKISVLNNQTAMLKVVDNQVYFTITAQTTPGVSGSAPIVTYTSEVHTVPVGFVMSVTPQIADTDEITLNVRPTISRIIAYVNDPNPALAVDSTGQPLPTPIVSRIPVIQAREMESVLKLENGQIAVMGGLMQDHVDNKKDAVPGLANLPLIGNAFSYRNETATKTELVVLLRPVVIRQASLSGDYRDVGMAPPPRDFFQNKPAIGSEGKQP